MTIPFLYFQGTVMAVFQTAAWRKKSGSLVKRNFRDEWSTSTSAFIQSARKPKKRLFIDSLHSDCCCTPVFLV